MINSRRTVSPPSVEKVPSWLKKEVFLKNGFTVISKRKPDFKLLALQLREGGMKPEFLELPDKLYTDGLYILRSPQCPYTEKNVNAMVETARSMGLEARVIDLAGHESAQRNRSPFGSFA